nr:hypothetical protein [Tanacetum cinerariifolium]
EKFPLPVKKVPSARRKEKPTAHKITLLQKSSSNCQSKSYDSYAKLVPHVSPCILGITAHGIEITPVSPNYSMHKPFWSQTGSASDRTGKKKGRTVTLTADDMHKRKNDVKERTTLLLSFPDEHQLRFRRTVTLTTEDMLKKKNDVKARNTLLLSLPDEHQLPFSKHKTTRELWALILKTFGGNEATKKMKKNLLKQHSSKDLSDYGVNL